jgi:hypothetical protein
LGETEHRLGIILKFQFKKGGNDSGNDYSTWWF